MHSVERLDWCRSPYPLAPLHQCCGTGTGTVETVTFWLVEPEPEPELVKKSEPEPELITVPEPELDIKLCIWLSSFNNFFFHILQ